MNWERLTFDDIVQAKAATNRRRVEILARHAEEMRALVAEEAEVAALDRLIDEFAGKFGHVDGPAADAPIDTATEEPDAAEPAAEEPEIAAASAEPKAPAAEPARSSRDRRDQKERSKPQTVFDTFSRALSRNL